MSENTLGSDKEARLRQRMAELGLREEDLVEKFVQGGGPGGQKINKTASCVCLSYPSAGIDIKCQRTRSLAMNRYYARWELCERIAARVAGERSRRQQEAERRRRQKRRRSRRQQARLLDDKRRHGAKKARRGPVAENG